MRRLARAAIVGGALAAGLGSLGPVASSGTPDTEAWLADYRMLRDFMSTHYANLEWALRTRGLDPVALDAETIAAIREAGTEDEAVEALRSFVRVFRDGHARIDVASDDRSSGSQEETTIPGDTAPATACQLLGVEDGHIQRLRFNLDAPGLPEGTTFAPLPVSENAYEGGVLSLDGRRYGFIRIPIFAADWHLGACEREWRSRAARAPVACDAACQERFLDYDVPERLMSEFAQRLNAFAELGLTRLIVDITRNGGGNDWVDPVARMVGGPDLVCPRLGVTRTASWDRILTGVLESISVDEGPSDAAQRRLLTRARGRVNALLAQVRAPCADPQAIWSDGPGAACSRLTDAPLSSCGVFDRPVDASVAALRSGPYVFTPGTFRAPVAPRFEKRIVLIDGNTASAAEIFAALLQDNGAATLVGQRTHGAGCGYMEGGSRIRLKHSRLEARFPNCQRLRRDGTNEADGVRPDLPVPWEADDSPETQRRKLLDALRTPHGP